MTKYSEGFNRGWRSVRPKEPCPICHKTQWCQISADGALVMCRHNAQGAFETKTDKNGAEFYLHRLTGDARRPRVEVPSGGASTQRADADVLHRVYDALLGTLGLSGAHRDRLRGRGLPDDEIERRLYRSLPRCRHAKAHDLAERFGAETLLSVPGFITTDGKSGKYITIAGSAGLLIPCRNADGKIVALKVRRDGEGHDNRYTYLSSAKYGGAGPGAPIHVPLGTAKQAEVLRITEGELKADIASVLSGLPTISFPGVTNWKVCLPVLQQLGTKKVLIAFDADAGDKADVARALSNCYETLIADGYVVAIEKWDARHKGIDDLLAAGGKPEVLDGDAARDFVAEALLTATMGEPPPPSPLDRLPEVLAEGAEKLFGDKELLQALARLAENDAAEFACWRAKIKTHGVSLRDLDSALASFRQKIRAEKPPLTSAGEYKVSGGRIVHIRPTKDGPIESPLCNFSARIVAQTTVDDGAEKSICLEIEGQHADGSPLPRCEVAAEKFGWLEWIIPSWGTRAVVNAGASTKDHLRCALQLLSGDIQTRTVFAHLGWRKIGEHWVYLHAGGAIDANGPVDGIEVAAPSVLERYVLPLPPSGDELRRAVGASLALLDFGPPLLAFPLLASVYRSVLGACDFAVHLMGQSGVYKSEYAALLQKHFGSEMDRSCLPASWASTANALESTAFACKDALLVVDDFAPTGTPNDVARLHREAERLIRAQGNGAGRGRMRRDGSLAPAKSPRGLILSTGEDAPRGQSLRARLLILECGKGDFGPSAPMPNPALSACQRDAGNGLYAAAMAAFLRWLAPRYETIRAGLAAERANFRDAAAGDGQHARTPNLIADLAIGLRYFLDFAAHVAAIDETRYADLWDRGWRALCEAGAAQQDHQTSADPVATFLRLLSAAVASGRAHIADTKGDPPKEARVAWGYRERWFGTGENATQEWQPQGRCVGWVDGESLYLEPDAAYASAQGMAREQGESLSASQRTLWKRMRERGLLTCESRGDQRFTVRRQIAGKQTTVLFLHADALSLPETGHSGHSGHSSEKREGNDGVSMAGSSPMAGTNRPLADEPAIETVQNPAEFEANGRFPGAIVHRHGEIIPSPIRPPNPSPKWEARFPSEPKPKPMATAVGPIPTPTPLPSTTLFSTPTYRPLRRLPRCRRPLHAVRAAHPNQISSPTPATLPLNGGYRERKNGINDNHEDRRID